MQKSLLLIALSAFAGMASAQTTLSSFTFNNAQFGDTLGESDGGAFSAANWLNTSNSNPGNPGYLTGANFETGVANIGFSGATPVYTIGYTAGITNAAGADLGIVVARYSTDPVYVWASTDGVNYSSTLMLSSASAVGTGVLKNYYYGGGGPYMAELYVHSLDFSSLGFANGDVITSVKITGDTQLDLIRAAGFQQPVPEPATMAALGLGLAALARRRRKNG